MTVLGLILIAIGLFEVVNITSYQYFCYQVGGRARMTLVRRAGKTNTMNYLCPSTFNRARASFLFALPKLYGGITLIDYINTGMDPKRIAEQVLQDIRENGYHGVVITISTGDTIAAYLDGSGENIDIISINPCHDASALRAGKVLVFALFLPFANLANFLVGWLGYAPLLFSSGENCSFSLRLSSLNSFIFFANKNYVCEDLWGVVLSRYDELLDNRWLFDEYDFLPPDHIELIDTAHSRTLTEIDKYQLALDVLLEKIY